MEVRFIVEGRAQQRGSKKVGLIPKRGGGWLEKNGRPIIAARDSNEKSKDWMYAVQCAVRDVYNGPLLHGPIEMYVEYYFARPLNHYGTGRNANKLKPSALAYHAQSPDLDKLDRCLGDALTKVLYHDDKLVFKRTSQRLWTDGAERTIVVVREMEQIAPAQSKKVSCAKLF